jgi:hypothetical protein
LVGCVSRTRAVEGVCQSVTYPRQRIHDQATILRAAIRVLAHGRLDRDIAGVLEETGTPTATIGACDVGASTITQQ